MLKPNMMNFEDESIIEVSNFEIQPEENFIKRLFDILVSVCLFVITSPLMLIRDNFSQSNLTGTSDLQTNSDYIRST